jgi:hypothetical protein
VPFEFRVHAAQAPALRVRDSFLFTEIPDFCSPILYLTVRCAQGAKHAKEDHLANRVPPLRKQDRFSQDRLRFAKYFDPADNYLGFPSKFY